MRSGKYILLSLALAALVFGCRKAESDADASREVNFSVAHPAQTRGYGLTGYDATEFANTDQIGIFVMKSREVGDDTPQSMSDMFKNYYNVGYNRSSPTINTWSPSTLGNQVTISVPVFPLAEEPLDIYAYYPWAGLGNKTPVGDGSPVIVNIDDTHNIRFKILQNQTNTNKNYCNIMRARPIKRRTFSISDAASYNVELQFEHVMSLVDINVYTDNANGWDNGDILLLDKVVVLGTKVSTEGFFDIASDTPNVRITHNASSSNSSVYMVDANAGGINASRVPDAFSGATPGGRMYMKRSVVIPPVSLTSEDDPGPDEMGELEILLAMRFQPAGGTAYSYTNRRYVVKGVTLESGKRYAFNMRVRKNDPEQQVLTVRASASADWDATYTLDTEFN